MMRLWTQGSPSAGLFAGALAWLTSTQANYALAGWACAAGLPWLTPVIAAGLVAVSLAGGFLSWRSWSHEDAAAANGSAAAQPRRLMAGIGVLSAMLFALVIATQGTAGFVLHGCER